MRSFLVLCLFPAFGLAIEKPDYDPPKPTKSDEAKVAIWSAAKAGEYLDAVGVNWTRDRQCMTCHTNMAHVMAGPTLPVANVGWKEVRTFLEDDVKSWSTGGKPKGDAFVVVNAVALAFTDARTTGKLHELTKVALDRMWTVQLKSGEWNWLKCELSPLEHDDYYGAVLAAVAVGVAPGGYAESDGAKAGLAKLKAYLKATPVPDLHHKAMLLWANSLLKDLMTDDEAKATIVELQKLQHADGGWCLPSLGNYIRRDKTPNDKAAPSDGYGTGFTLFVLRQAGVSKDDKSIVAGVKWLKANQRESGRWYTRSLNNDKAHYITNAGTAFCVLALDACGEK
jgi:squalene-hopene/tetraprenyl-beta-curcumene cyclase